jgi:hypothetical protein
MTPFILVKIFFSPKYNTLTSTWMASRGDLEPKCQKIFPFVSGDIYYTGLIQNDQG